MKGVLIAAGIVAAGIAGMFIGCALRAPWMMLAGVPAFLAAVGYLCWLDYDNTRKPEGTVKIYFEEDNNHDAHV